MKKWAEKVDGLTLRERVAVFFCALAVTYFFWDTLLMQPLYLEEKKMSSQIQKKQAEQLSLNVELQKLDFLDKSDPDKAAREELQNLKSQLKVMENRLQDMARNLIEPTEMAGILKTVLLKVEGLELIQMKGLGGFPLSANINAGAPGDAEAGTNGEDQTSDVISNVYKHGLRIVFDGDYHNTLEYIRSLENLGWGFFWESLDLKVREYPYSVVTVTVYTLSLDKNWIGV